MSHSKPRTPITLSSGDRYGMLSVLREGAAVKTPQGAVRSVVCLCDCGNEKTIRLASIRKGMTRSCGCLQRLRSSEAAAQRATHGASRTAAYRTWNSMRRRCNEPTDKAYPNYGGRGIAVCEDWNKSFQAFIAYVGERPTGMTLDRINNNGNYEPGNVRWATMSQQARNRRSNHLHTIDGITKCMADWCEELGEPWTSVKKRIELGRDPFARIYKRRVYGIKSPVQQNA